MRTIARRTLSATALMAGAGLALTPGATASPQDDHVMTADLTQLNDSGASGTAWVWAEGDEVKVKIETQGLLADAPHAQHLHVGGDSECPPADEEGEGPNGELRTSDAAEYYGDIVASLTTEGDFSPDSGLAVDRFPVGDSYTYERTITDADVAQGIRDGEAVIVVHGVDHNGNGSYDGPASDLDPELPGEATNPAMCGEVTDQMGAMPEGGVDTGMGGTQDGSDGMVAAAGATAVLAGAGGLMMLGRRRATQASR